MRLRRSLLALTLAALGFAASPVMPQTGPVPGPEEGAEKMMHYSDTAYRDVVRKYVRDSGERVDYAAWKDNAADRAALDGYIALLAQVSPESHPGLFPTVAAGRGYWINAYNALVLQGVLEFWPLNSVREVKATLSSRLIPGKGFFYDRKVVVGGLQTNLYDLGKQILRTQKDARLHFALNCASQSCPVLRAWEWSDEQLDLAAREFINQPENVEVADGKLYLSRIFKWYRKDFPAEIRDYLAGYAEPVLADALRTARDHRYPVRYRDYDWALNAEIRASDDAP